MVDAGVAQVEVDEDHVAAGPGQGHRQVRGRRGLAFALARARDHDRAYVVLELADVQAGLEDPERLGARPCRLGEGGQRLAVGGTAVRLGDVAEQRHSQAGAQLVGRAHAGVERLAQERQPDAQREPDEDTQGDVAARFRLHLRRAAGRPDHHRARAGRLQASAAPRDRGRCRRSWRESGDPLSPAAASAASLRRTSAIAVESDARVEAAPVDRELRARTRVASFSATAGTGIGDRERQEVGGRVCAHARVGEQSAGRCARAHRRPSQPSPPPCPRAPALPAWRHTGRVGRRRRVRAERCRSRVLRVHEHRRRRLVQRLLGVRHQEREQGDDHNRREHDPALPYEQAEPVAERRLVTPISAHAAPHPPGSSLSDAHYDHRRDPPSSRTLRSRNATRARHGTTVSRAS